MIALFQIPLCTRTIGMIARACRVRALSFRALQSRVHDVFSNFQEIRLLFQNSHLCVFQNVKFNFVLSELVNTLRNDQSVLGDFDPGTYYIV